jgi:ketosteroid isomerase-like protein
MCGGCNVDGNWDDFRERCQAALAELVEGRPEPFKELWSPEDDVSIMGAFGAYEKGWADVGPRLDWASSQIGATDRTVENLVTVVGTDLAYTVDLEHMERTVDGERIHRVLRCTQIYRLEHGEWRITHRHADELITTL